MKLDYCLFLYITKIDLKWIKDLNIKPETINYIRRKHRYYNYGPSTQRRPYEFDPKGKESKLIINEWDYVKLKIFCTAKESTNKTKRQPTKREKVFANNSSDKELICKIYKELIKLNTSLI